MVDAYLGLGSNLGDRRQHLERAIAGLRPAGEVVAVSSLYETAPVGGPPQGDYLNQVARLSTVVAARPLLEACQAIEAEGGRDRRERFGPRTIDIDLLLYGSMVIDQPGLTVPHPRMIERRFVLDPLLEIWPDAQLPDGTRLDSFLEAVSSQQAARIPTNSD